MDVSGLGIAADQTREAHVNGKRIAVQRQDRVAGRGGTSGRGFTRAIESSRIHDRRLRVRDARKKSQGGDWKNHSGHEMSPK